MKDANLTEMQTAMLRKIMPYGFFILRAMPDGKEVALDTFIPKSHDTGNRANDRRDGAHQNALQSRCLKSEYGRIMWVMWRV